MKKNKRKIASIILALCMILSSLTVFADEVNPTGHTLYQYSQSEEMVQWFEENKSELLEEHKKKYPTESGWWDEYAVMPSLTGVISGYPDGTLKPNNPVTGGEFAKMVATAFEGYIPSGGRLDSKFFDGKWYNNYYNAIAKAFPYYYSDTLYGNLSTKAYSETLNFMELPIKRSEVAYVLASIIDKDSLKGYINKVKVNDLSTMSDYVDFSQHIFRGKQFIDSEGHTTDLMDWKWIFVNELRSLHGLMPQNQAAAIMMLKDLGIMVGDGAGHISPLGNVTRAEIFKLLNECCKATKDYTSLKFFGWEYAGYDFFTKEELKALPWVYTMETVINPEAEEKYQYTFGDIRWGNSDSYKKNEVMTGRHNTASHFTEIFQQYLSIDFEKKLVDEVLNSITYENGIVKVYIPPFISDYHEIVVRYMIDNASMAVLNSTDNIGWNEINTKAYQIKKDHFIDIEICGKGRYTNINRSEYFAEYDLKCNTPWSGESLPDWLSEHYENH